MRSVFLIAAVVALTTAQTLGNEDTTRLPKGTPLPLTPVEPPTPLENEERETPPHTLTMPKTWKLGVEHTISITVYDWTFRRRDVNATLYVKECWCSYRPRYQKNCGRKRVVSSDRVEVNPGQAALLNINLPKHNDVADKELYLSITSTVGETFVDERRLYFTSSSRGIVMVRTDKPIYKPEQKVKFCILALDATTRPRAAVVTARITDSRSRSIEKWENVKIPDSGYRCLELQLADEPPMGMWRINIREIIDTGSCSNYYGSISEGCRFEVKEFVLPKFEVKVEGPKYLTREDDHIEGEVSAEYVFGEPVEGNVIINYTLTAARRRESFLFHTIRAPLVNGKHSFSIDSERYRNILRYRFDPFCVSSSIEISAEVEEKGRGTKFIDEMKFRLVANEVNFEFDEGMKETFKPGLPYTMKIRSLRHDKSPAPKQKFRYSVMGNNGDVQIVKPKKIRQTDKNGEYMTTFTIPDNVNCIRILITPIGEFSCEERSICYSPVPAYSPSNCFMHMDVSNKKPKEGDTITVSGEVTQKIGFLQCLVISKGKVLSHETRRFDSNVRKFKWDLEVTCDHSPRFQIVCYHAREDGEICGDVMELGMDCCSPHKVGMEFYKTKDSSLLDNSKGDTVRPQTDVFLNVTSTPNTPVLVSVYDKSLSLLADFCDSGKQSKLCKTLDRISPGSVSIDASCDVTQRLQCKPVEWNEPQRIDIQKILNFLGVTVTTNMYLPEAPRISPPVTRPEIVPFSITVIGDTAIPTTPPSGEELAEEEEVDNQVRRFFPESWLFDVVETNDEGVSTVDATAPDTITMWHGEAVALSKKEGIGFSELTPLTVYKPFFVSLELPYSVNYGESVIIKPVLFNFWDKEATAKVTVTVHEDLSILGTVPGTVTVRNQSSTHFNLKLLTRGIGRLRIRIKAEIRGKKYSDTVEKNLFVKPGCVKYETVNTLFVNGSGDETFNFKLPKCTIPKSHQAFIVIKGDLMSPPKLENLLVVPTGCGEQNMARTAINFVVAKYLQSTKQFTPAIRARITGNLKIGYQRELNYQLFSGAFAVWPSSSPSLWLTAFVLRSLSDIHSFYGEESFVDSGVLSSAFNYIVKQQQEDGSFKRIGYTTNYRLLDDNVPMTAYVMIALNRYPVNNRRRHDAIRDATAYLLNYTAQVDLSDMCTYSLALTNYALTTVGNSSDEHRYNLKKAIRNSVDHPGTCYVCNSCTLRDNGNDETCAGELPKSDPISSDCVETTAYTLLSLLEAKDDEKTPCLAQWLLKQQNSYGSYGSSQDTIVALESLAMFAERSFTPTLNLNINVNQGGNTTDVSITDENRYARHEIVVSSVPGEVDVTWSGKGTALIQSVLTYHGCDCCNASSCFDLTADREKNNDIVNVEMCFRHKCPGRSNMAILDAELPSGCVYEKYQVTKGDANIRREERKGGSVVLYMDEVAKKSSCITVTCEQKFTIGDPKPAPVTIYDYYMPTKRVSVFYDTA